MNRFALPIFLTRRNRYFYALLWTAIGAILYLSSNHFPVYAPRFLPMTQWDRMIPFVPWTVWIYSSEMFLFFAVYLFSRDLANANRYLYSFLALQIISSAIFIIWPTTYPRDQFPLPTDLSEWTMHIFRNLRQIDSPTNCLPSLHVSSCYLSAFMYLDEQRGKFPIFFLWSTAIAISTLTTKQHYIIDVVTGIGMAILLYFIFHRLVPYRNAIAVEAAVPAYQANR